MSGGIDAISAQLRDIEADVLEFSVGVSHGALDEERERNTRILESIEQVTNKLEQTRTPDNRKEMVTAKRLTKTINGNIETLRYLESISCLENIFTDVTKAATIAAVDLSNVTAIKPQVLSTRYLTENVKQCWNYTSRLSELAAVHLKAAADFHEFNHDVNEINCHASRMKKLALNNVETFSPKGTIDEARKLAKELEERLKSWKDLSERSNRLVAKGGSVLPIVNRLLSVKDGVAEDFEADGPIMVQMLMTYVGANFTVNKGDCLPLLNTMESPYLWKVETSTGAQYIPSIACLVVSSNDGQVVDAQASEEKILLGWRDALLNYKKQLAVYYRVYFESICKNNNVKISEGRAQSELMDDLNKLLVHDDVDSGKLACALEVLNSKKQIKKNSGAGVVLTRSDLEELRRPLNELKGHISGIAGAETLSGKAILENNKYLSSGLFEARGMASQLETLRMKHEESHTSMNELYDKIKNWRTVYDNSIQGPKGGVGRLVLSRSAVNVESSSGVSSDEASPIPQLPLPYGRISSFNVAAKFDPLPLTSLPIASDRPRVQKSKVFSGAANIPFPQIETGVNVRIKERSELITGTLFDDVPPKYMRDVATQIMVMQKTMYAQTKLHGDTIDSGQFGSQVETTRVDCMTQIGCVKATKQQQVHSTTITAARKWTDAVHISPEVAEESVHINPKFTTFAVDSTQRIPTQDLMTQINDARFAHRNTVTNEYETRSNEIAGRKLSLCSADLEANKSIRSMTLETSPQLIADSGVQAGIESMSREFETRIQNKMTGYTESSFAPPKQNEFGMQHRPEQSINSFNTTLNQQNILYQPNVQSFQTKNILREDFGFQVSTDVAHDGIQTTNEMLTTNLVGPKMAPPHVHEFQTIPVMQNSQKLQISANVAECENQTEKNTAIGNIAAPKTQEINQCLTNFQMDTISRGSANLQMKAGVIKSENNIKIEMLDGHVNSNNEYPFRVTEECFDHNIKDKTQHGDMSGRASYTYETIKPQSMSAQLVHQLQKQFVDCSTQVGSVLVPETMQVIPVPLTVVDMQTANRLGMKLDAVLCPSKMQLRSMLTEKSGINVVEVGTMKQVDVQIGEQMFVGSIDQSFKNRNTRHATIETPKAEVCYLQLLSQGKEPLTPNADTISGLSSSIGHHEVSSMLATAGCSISLRCPEMASCTIGTCPNCYTSISTTEFVTSTSVKQGGRFEMTTDQEVGQTEFNRCKNISTSMDRIDFGLNNHDSSVVARSANYGAKVANLQTVGYEFSSKPLPMTAVCNYCKGSGINVETETAQLTQTISLNAGRHPTYQNNQNYHASNMKTAEVQVGTLLKPTSIEIANVNVKTRTAELATQLGINVDSIMCPSNVRMEAELTETAGIQVLGIGEMKDIQVQKGRNLFNADIQTHRPWTKNCSKLSAGPRLEQCTIQNETSSLTLDHAVIDLETADQRRQTPAFAVQNIGCTVTLKNAEIGTVCNICNGSGKYIGSGIKSRAMRAAESPVGTVDCSTQVGSVLVPETMQVIPVPLTVVDMQTANRLGMKLDAVLCPSKMQLRSMLTEESGINVVEVGTMKQVDVQIGEQMFVGSIDQSFKNRNTRHATIETPKAEVCYLQLLSQGKEPLTPNAGTTSGLSSSIGHHDVSSMLATAGCSISLRCPEMASCTIGTCPNCYTSISTTEFVTSTSVKQGGRFEMTADQEVGQTEFNRCKNISTSMDRIDFGLNNHDSSVVARSANYGAKVANLQTVGYEFSSKPLPMTAVCNYCKGSGINVETETAQLTQTISLNAGRHPTYQNNQNYHASNMKTAEVQVGTLLKPTSIEIANVNVKTRTAELANQLGINVDSIMCPSNVRMEAELTETAGIQVLGIGDMKDIQVQKGRNLFNADIQTHRPWTKNCSKLSAGPRIEQCTIQNETSSLTLGHAVTDLETADQGRQTTAFAVQNIGCTVTLKNAEICTVCNICNGSGKYIGLGIKSRIMKAAECQVGTVFIPTTMQITNCPIKPRTSELAEQLGMTVDSIMCPSNISMRAELTDQGGIEILDIKDSRNLEVQAGGKMFNADVKTQRAYSSGAISKKAESRMSNLNIRSDGRGVTIGQVSSQLQRFENSNNSTNNECFSLHDIGCEIIFTKASIGTECSLCHGTGKDIGTFSKSSSLLKSTVLSKPTPSVKNKLSVSSGKSIACQVGTILKPVVVQLANINIQTNSPQLMKDLGIQADTVIVPSTVQLESELCETTGIQVKDIKDMKFVELQSGGGAYNADIKSTFSSRTQNSFVSQNAQKRLVNLRGNRLGLTLGTAEKNEKIGDVSSFSKGFTLQDVGCEFVVKCDSKRALCNTCNGSGMSLASFANASQLMNVNNQSNRAIFEKQQLSLRSSQQVSSSVLRDGTSQVHKSCQVGVLLTPSTVHVSKVDLVPTERRSATMVGLPMQAIVCPASIDMHTMLTETSGIRVNDITNMGAVNMDVGGKSYVATVGRNVSPKRNVFEAAGNAETCILEIRGSPKQIEYGMHSTNQSKMTSSQVTGSKYALKNIGCEFRLRDGNMCSSCKTTNSNNLENSKSSNLGSAHKIASSSGKHVACQVGILLIPSVVQVADMQLDLSDSKMSNSLGLKPNAILCPSTVELNSRLTETSGINVMDIREVKEIGIIMGDKTYSADLQGRQKNIRGISANFEKPEQCYLKFETRQSAELIGRHTLFNQTSASIPQTPNKRIDTNAGCTFRIKQVSMEGKAPISSTTINSQSLRPIREKNQHITEKKDNVGCQVGVIMIPNVMEISPAIVTIEDTSSAKLLGVPVGSRMQHTIMGLETRLAEKSGIEIASVNEVDQITVKLGKEKFVARIGDGERSNKTSISLGGVSIGLWNQPNKEMNVHESKLNRDSKRAETSISGKEMLKGVHVSHLASYLIRQISHSSGTVLELHTMTSNGKKIHLRFNEDLRSKLAVSNDRFTGFLSTNSSPRDFCTPTAGSIENRLRALRGEVTLCDVACEALIKPNTFEKKQQTEFSG